MIKKIKLTDIKTYLINQKKPYQILEAGSSKDSISVYFNESQRIRVFHKCENMYEYVYEEIENENNEKGKNIENRHNGKNYDLFFSFLTLYLCLYPITCLFIIYFHLFTYSEYAFIISFFISNIIVSVILLIIELFANYVVFNRVANFSIKSNCTAIHMVCNFIERRHRLPRTIQEFRHANRIHKFFNTDELIFQDDLIIISNALIISIFCVVISASLTLLGFTINHSVNVCIILFLIICTICYEKQICIHYINFFTVLRSYFLQYTVITTKNVTDESLIMAYIAACEWFKMVHYEEFDDNAYKNFLDSLNVSIIHKDETDQP